jgi:hypothetical protein
MKEVALIADRLIVLLPIEVKLGQAQEQTSMFHIFSDDAIDDMTDSFPLVTDTNSRAIPICVSAIMGSLHSTCPVRKYLL